MENQHRLIKGYKELSQEQINLMNTIKSKGAELLILIKQLEQDKETDKRWVSIGKTDLQTGFMALTRSVTKPDFL